MIKPGQWCVLINQKHPVGDNQGKVVCALRIEPSPDIGGYLIPPKYGPVWKLDRPIKWGVANRHAPGSTYFGDFPYAQEACLQPLPDIDPKEINELFSLDKPVTSS